MPHHPETESPLTPGRVLRSIFGGILMGLANLVPGISGGTMLLAAGVYPSFINGIAEVSTFRFRLRTIIVLSFIIGAALIAVVALAGPVSQLVVHHRWIMYSLFIGLTLGGVPVIWKMVKPVDSTVIVMSIIGIALMATMVLIKPGSGGSAEGSHPYAMYFLAGMAGASAMVLPGVSGGYLLLVLGQYVAILTAVSAAKDAASARDWSALMDTMHVIIPVGLGVIVGVVGISNLIKILLARYERATLGLLLGLLLGAVLGLWPFQKPVDELPLGSVVKGQEVTGENRAMFEIADYPTATFRPSIGTIGGSVGLVLIGLAASLGVARVGRSQDA